MHQGRVVFGAMDEVVFGRPAAEAVVEQMDRLGANRAFLMVSGTLNRETDEISRIRTALGMVAAGVALAVSGHLVSVPARVILSANRVRVDLRRDHDGRGEEQQEEGRDEEHAHRWKRRGFAARLRGCRSRFPKARASVRSHSGVMLSKQIATSIFPT